MSDKNVKLQEILSKHDKIRDYEDRILSDTDMDVKKKKNLEEKINKFKDILDNKTEELISNEDIIPSEDDLNRETEEMETLLKDDELSDIDIKEEVKEVTDKIEGFGLENSGLFNMINITQEDMFILILAVFILFFRKEIINFIKKKM
jgi:hypothetical protein